MNWLDILELPNIKLISVEVLSDKIIFEVECTNGSAVCHVCGKKCSSIHSVVKKEVKDMPILKKKCFIRFHHRRFYCEQCNKTFMERLSWVDEYERYTSRYAEWVGKAGKEIDVKSVAELIEENYKVVERIVYYRNRQLILPPFWEFPETFGIDEFAYKKGKKDYGVIIASKGKIWHVLPSRKEDKLRDFFSKIRSSVREKVLRVSMDMWATFINLIKEFFPNASIVLDRFHVMKQLNKAVDKIRKSIQKHLSKEQKKELKGLRWAILRNADKLSEDEKPILKKAFSFSRMLHKAYLRKEEFRQIFDKNTSKEKARRKLELWIKKAEKIQHRSMNTFLKTLDKRKEYILNYFDYCESNGFMEGIINKIKTIKRQHYGLPNFAHLQQKILLSFT